MPQGHYERAHLYPLGEKPSAGSVLFLSDLHLDYQTPARVAVMAHVISQVFQKASAVVILGDVGDGVQHADCRRFMERLAGRVLSALRGHAERGVTPLYVPGNHDGYFRKAALDWPAFAVRSFQAEAPVRLTLLGRRVRLSHGDEYDAGEEDPRMVNMHAWLNREPVLRQGRNVLNPWLRYVKLGLYEMDYWFWRNTDGLARWLEPVAPDVSCELFRRVAWAERAPGAFVHNLHVWEDAARRLLRLEKPDLVAMGHTHVAMLEQMGEGVYLNTGDWAEHAVVSWMDRRGLYQQDLSCEAQTRFLAWT